MATIAYAAFGLAALGGAAVVAGVLWTLFSQGVWGRVAGPPPGLSPEEARAWAQERARAGSEGRSWQEVRAALTAGQWRDVWPVLLILGGMVGVLVFLPLGILLGTGERLSGAAGLALGLLILWRAYRALQEH